MISLINANSKLDLFNKNTIYFNNKIKNEIDPIYDNTFESWTNWITWTVWEEST